MDNSLSWQHLLYCCKLPYGTVTTGLVYSGDREKYKRGELTSCFHLVSRKLWAAPGSKEQAHIKTMKHPLSMVPVLTFL